MRLLRPFLLGLALVLPAVLLAQPLVRPNPRTATADQLLRYSWASTSPADKVTMRWHLYQRFPGTVEALLGQAYHEARYGDEAKEIQLYRQALAKNPDNLYALYNLAVSLADTRPYEAEALARRIIDKAPGFNHHQTFRILYFNIYVNALKNQTKADSLIRQWKPRLGNHYILPFLEGIRLEVQDKNYVAAAAQYEEALGAPGGEYFFETWQRLLNLQTGPLLGHSGTATLQDKYDRLGRLIVHVKDEVSAAPQGLSLDQAAFVSTAAEYIADMLKSDDYEQVSLEMYQASWLAMPRIEVAHKWFELRRGRNGNPEAWMEFAEQVAVSHSDLALAQALLGRAYEYSNNLPKAAECYKKAFSTGLTSADRWAIAQQYYLPLMQDLQGDVDGAYSLLVGLLGNDYKDKASITVEMYYNRVLAGKLTEARQHLAETADFRRKQGNINEEFFRKHGAFLDHWAALDSIARTGSFIRSTVGIAATAGLISDWAEFAPDGRTALMGYAPMELWDLQKKSKIVSYLGTLSGPRTFSPDGKYFAIATRVDADFPPTLLLVIETGTGRLVSRYVSQWGLSAPSWSPDGKRLAFIVGGNEMLVLDALTGKQLVRGHAAFGKPQVKVNVRFTADGNSLVVMQGYFGGRVGIVDAQTLAVQQVLSGPDFPHVSGVSPLTGQVLVVDNNRTLFMYTPGTWRPRAVRLPVMPNRIVFNPKRNEAIFNDWGGRMENRGLVLDLDSLVSRASFNMGPYDDVTYGYLNGGDGVVATDPDWGGEVRMFSGPRLADWDTLRGESDRLLTGFYHAPAKALITWDEGGVHYWGLEQGRRLGGWLSRVDYVMPVPEEAGKGLIFLRYKGLRTFLYHQEEPRSAPRIIDSLDFRVTWAGYKAGKWVLAGRDFYPLDKATDRVWLTLRDGKTWAQLGRWQMPAVMGPRYFDELTGVGISGIDLSPDGTRIAVATWWIDGWRRGLSYGSRVRVLNTADGRIATYNLANTARAQDVWFDGNDNLVVDKRQYRLADWENITYRNDRPVAAIRDFGQARAFKGLEIPDLAVKVEGRASNELVFTNAASGRQVGTLVVRRGGEWVFFTDNNQYESSYSAPQRMFLYERGNLALPFDQFFESYFQPHLFAETLTNVKKLGDIQGGGLGLSGTGQGGGGVSEYVGLGNAGTSGKGGGGGRARTGAVKPRNAPAPAPTQAASQPVTEPGPSMQELMGAQLLTNARQVPVVRITYPQPGQKFQGSTRVLLEVEEQGGGLLEVRLYQNGKLVGIVDHSGRGENPPGTKLEETFSLPLVSGTNELRAVAVSKARVESAPVVVKVESEALQPQASLYILAVGLDKYRNSQYDLNFGAADMQAFGDAVKGVGKDIFRTINVVNLRDAQANRARLVAVFDSLQKLVKPEDVFIFFYAGHGVMSEGDDAARRPADFFFVLHGVTQMFGNDDLLEAQGFSASELKTRCAAIAAQKQMVVLDACQSGAAVETFAVRGAEKEKAIMQLGRSTGVVVMASTGSEQFASEFPKLGHGVFTYAFLEGLSGKADGGTRDGKITVKELESYLTDRIPELTQLYRGKQQWPNSYSKGQDFPIGLVKH